MTPQTIRTIPGLVLALACAVTPALAQSQPANAPRPSGDQSASALAQEATNPFSTSWLLQMQQNNNWVEMPLGEGTRVQSNLLFQPLMSLRLTEKWGLYMRPVLTIVNSSPGVDRNGERSRTAGFGDTVLGVAAARPLLGGRLVLGVGPTFVFPTASEHRLGQDTWQVGPDAGVTLLGKHFIAYGFVQQWFKAGGNGAKTDQMNGVFNFTYSFNSGWTVGTQPQLSVDWEAPNGERATFAVGPQVGRICTCGGIPTLIQVGANYYPVRPSVGGPKWNVQLQLTPTIPALIKKRLF
jgi:Putative MetA-pathway of phenol degradation